MKATQARRILGLKPREDPRPRIPEFRVTRKRLAEELRAAPNEEAARRQRKALTEYDQALALMSGDKDVRAFVPLGQPAAETKAPAPAKGTPAPFKPIEPAPPAAPPERPAPAPSPAKKAPKPAAKKAPKPAAKKTAEKTSPHAKGRIVRVAVALFVLLSLCAIGGRAYQKRQEDARLEKAARIASLERQGAAFIENRRWPEATEAFRKIESIDPASGIVAEGRLRIEAGIAEEQNQFIGYWKGEAIASFEAKRWDDAEKAANQVLAKFPDEAETKALTARIAEARRGEEREKAFVEIREMIAKREFDAALSAARALAEKDAGAAPLLQEAQSAKDHAEADLRAARDLMAKAAAMDKGVFNQEALDLMRDALSLAPDDAEVAALHEKLAAYTRTIRVPGDYETVREALAASRDRDRLLLGEGTWEGPLLIPAAVELVGVPGKTIVRCAADAGGVITVAAGVKGARVSGLTLRHLSFDAGAERFSLALVQGAEADFSDCRFEQGSGHGIAVTGGGQARVQRCRFTENGWNGIAAMGAGSLIVAEGNILDGNFQNGIEAWDGASAILSKNKCTGNSRNGIHFDGAAASVAILGNTLSGNREFGLVLGAAGGGEVADNTLSGNLLGGIVVKAAAAKAAVKGNVITGNEGPGLALAKGLSSEAYAANRISGNKGSQTVADLDLSGGE